MLNEIGSACRVGCPVSTPPAGCAVRFGTSDDGGFTGKHANQTSWRNDPGRGSQTLACPAEGGVRLRTGGRTHFLSPFRAYHPSGLHARGDSSPVVDTPTRQRNGEAALTDG